MPQKKKRTKFDKKITRLDRFMMRTDPAAISTITEGMTTDKLLSLVDSLFIFLEIIEDYFKTRDEKVDATKSWNDRDG